jgi:hypothetical protein
VLIGKHGQLDVLAATEVRGVAGRELADQDQVDACGFEVLPGAVQLDGVRAAIDSAVVAQPDQGCGAVLPEVAKADRSTVVVLQDDLRQLVRTGRRVGLLATCGSPEHGA